MATTHHRGGHVKILSKDVLQLSDEAVLSRPRISLVKLLAETLEPDKMLEPDTLEADETLEPDTFEPLATTTAAFKFELD
jgi:hypothetical protein